MNRYIATVRVKGQLIKTIVFADNQLHARLILEYQFGFDSLTSTPLQDIFEVSTSNPPTPQQQRITALQQQAKRSQQAVKQERILQQQQKLNQQRANLNKP
jgi:hypothetical protein